MKKKEGRTERRRKDKVETKKNIEQREQRRRERKTKIKRFENDFL